MRRLISLALVIICIIFATGFSNEVLSNYWEEELSKVSLDGQKQSFCFLKNEKIHGKNIDLIIKPASITKLYTTLWALETLGKNYRFKTHFGIKDNNLYISGGSDPYFVTENILLVLNKLHRSGYSSFDTVYFDSSFYINWQKKPTKIKDTIYKSFNKKLWSKATHTAVQEVNSFFQRNQIDNTLVINKFSVQKVVFIESFEQVFDSEFTLYSSPLYMHLKQVNMYSNNFYSDEIYKLLGGEEKFNQYIHEKFNTTSDEAYFYTGSGLGNNYTTCRITLKMLLELEEQVKNQGLVLSEILAVPGTDKGTMSKRFTGNYNKMILAKTGTLNDTSAFSGFIESKQNIKFAIFNHTKPHANKTPIRKLQDKVVKKKIDLSSDTSVFQYNSHDYISIKSNFFQ